MHTSCCKFVGTTLLCFMLFFLLGMPCKAEEGYQNPQTGYRVVVEDKLELLNEPEKAKMQEIMKEISAYGNVAFLSDEGGKNNKETVELAEAYYEALYGDASGVLFFIDMKSRYLYIYSYNEMTDIITKGYAETITDNVYKDATNGDYGVCAIRAYTQMLSLLQGQRISQPMKYISNTLLGIMLAFLISFFGVLIWHKRYIPGKLSGMEGVSTNVLFRCTHVTNKDEDKVYNPSNNPERIYRPGDSSDDFGGGFGGGSGGSGGSGGGHSF